MLICEVLTMRVAVPIWNERVSPVLDTAGTLLVVDVEGGQQISRRRIELPNGPLVDRVNGLTNVGVDVLLCGAVSRPLFDMLVAAGIEVTPFLSGDVDTLIRTLVENGTIDGRFLMPGCGRRGRRRRMRRWIGNGKESI